MLWIFVRPVLDDFDALPALRLLRAVLGDHVQLADVILMRESVKP